MLYSELKLNDSYENYTVVMLSISNNGKEFNNDTLAEIVACLDKPEYSGLVLNVEDLNVYIVHDLRCMLQTLRAVFGNDKVIYLNTDKSLDDLILMKNSDVDDILKYVDILI